MSTILDRPTIFRPSPAAVGREQTNTAKRFVYLCLSLCFTFYQPTRKWRSAQRTNTSTQTETMATLPHASSISSPLKIGLPIFFSGRALVEKHCRNATVCISTNFISLLVLIVCKCRFSRFKPFFRFSKIANFFATREH